MTNQLLIMSDDQRNDTIPYMANVVSRLQRKGTNFSIHRGNHSLCQPCRAGIFTGQYSKHHGVTENNDAIVVSSGYDHDLTIAKALDNQGVYCGLIGKYLNSESAQNPVGDGWSFWRQLVTSNQDNWAYSVWNGSSTSSPGTFVTDYMLTQISEFLAAATEPWFLVLTPTLPHYPFQTQSKFNHKWSFYNPVIYEETNLSTRPSWVQARTPLDETRRREIRSYARAHLRELSSLDEFVGGVLDLLDMSDTDIYYTTDNSIHYGEALLVALFDPTIAQKNSPYDASIKTPLIATGPSWKQESVDVPTIDQDISATFQAVAGATPVLSNQAGIDLRTIRTTPGSYTGRELLHKGVFVSGSPPLDQPSWDAISTINRKLVKYVGQSGTDQYELYALDTDPHELINRANDGGNDPLGGTWAAKVSALNTALSALLA